MTDIRLSHKFLSVFVVLALLLTFVKYEAPKTVAAQSQIGYVNGIDVNVRTGAGTTYASVGKLSQVQVEVIGSATAADGAEWKKIRYGAIEGYMHSMYIDILPPASDNSQPDLTFEQQLAQFPEDFKDALRALHASYPNWKFVADNLPVTFDAALNAESVFPIKLVPASYSASLKSMGKNAYNWSNGTWYKDAGDWVGASKELIAYHMDARNFLNITDVWMFADLSYDRTSQTREGVEKIVAGTFLADGFADKNDYNGSYIDIIMAAAEQSGVSPYMIASTIKQEQGVNGTSALISGNYNETYKGYYNFFNFGATGTTETAVIVNGLAFAKKQGWNSRSASIIGGAKRISGNYFSKGQNTYYYKNFDVKSGNYSFQYAQNIYDSKNSAASLRKIYIADTLSELTFHIPIYKNMWTTAPTKPAENSKKNNYYFKSLNISGFEMYKQNYAFSISGNTTIEYTVPDGASYAGAASYALKKGSNTVTLPVKAETGAINNYTLTVTAAKDCTLTVSRPSGQPTVPTVVLGDTNSDGKVSIVDLANVQKHLLKIITLSGENFTGADTNCDGKISIVDLANIQKHLLKIITLT